MRRAHANPDATVWLAVGLGIAVVGGVVYFMTRPPTLVPTPAVVAPGATQAAQLQAQQNQLVSQLTATPLLLR